MAPERGGRGLRGLAWSTVGALFLLMTLGNVVSATGSGLACPDWPLCHGRLVPPLRPDVLIEYGHRVAAALTSVLLVATIVVSMRRAPRAGTARLGAVLLALLGVQILLGGITVLLRLPHLISTAHLVNALLIFAGLLALCRKLRDVDAPARGRGHRDTDAAHAKAVRLAAAAVGALLAQLALGGYVRHSGAGLACPDFPLCSGDVFPDRWLAVVHWVHRWLGVLLLAHFVHLAAAGRRAGAGRGPVLALALAAVQVALGITTVLLQLSPPIRAAHAAVGYALWGVVVWTALGILGGGRAAARASREPLGTMARA